MSHRSSAQKPCNSAMSLTCVVRFQPGWVLIVHAPFDSARTYRPCLQATDGHRYWRSSGSAPDIAGKDIANPTALLQSAILMLRHIGEKAAADRVHAALERVYRAKEHLTRDIGGTAGTSEFADAVVAELQSAPVATAQQVSH